VGDTCDALLWPGNFPYLRMSLLRQPVVPKLVENNSRFDGVGDPRSSPTIFSRVRDGLPKDEEPTCLNVAGRCWNGSSSNSHSTTTRRSAGGSQSPALGQARSHGDSSCYKRRKTPADLLPLHHLLVQSCNLSELLVFLQLEPSPRPLESFASRRRIDQGRRRGRSRRRRVIRLYVAMHENSEQLHFSLRFVTEVLVRSGRVSEFADDSDCDVRGS